MKGRIAILSSILVMCGVTASVASDCVGAGCELKLNNIDYISWEDSYKAASMPSAPAAPVSMPVTYSAPVVPQYVAPVQYVMPAAPAMVSAKSLSIKPVPEDTRPAVWDGTNGNYNPRGYDKTVDWRDGVPIWDDSIVNYKYKDFSDWYLEPLPEIYNREVDYPSATVVSSAPVMSAPVMPVAAMPVAMMPANAYAPVASTPQIDAYELYAQNMEDAAATRARIEELLSPRRPCSNLWGNAPQPAGAMMSQSCASMAPRSEYVAQDMTTAVQAAFGRTDGCPFQSVTECEIWRRKPVMRETVSPRSPQIRAESLDDFVGAVKYRDNLTANDEVSAPLLDRYKMLMRSARACCTDGMAYQLKKAGASDALIYKFMSDDANFYGFGSRCLMMTDEELDRKYPNTSTAVVAADVRNGCLCRGRQWFSAMLAPFQQVYDAVPEFKNHSFFYKYMDGLQREVTVSVNTDVQNVMKQLSQCP